MTGKTVKIPGPDHPITIERNPQRVIVTLGEKEIANTAAALVLREANYPAVQYIPRADIDMSALERTDHGSHCPYKGDASYFSVAAGGKRSVNAAWSYETPYDAVSQISGHLAFYPDRVDRIEEVAA